MAYVEIRKGEKLITRRLVDEDKAKSGLRVRVGSAGSVHVAIGSPGAVGAFNVTVLAGQPPGEAPQGDVPPPDQGGPERQGATLDFSGCGTTNRGPVQHQCPEIGGYRVIEPLGQGGMGTVWRAQQLSTRREVALKVMVCHSAKVEQAEARFEREVELTARLDHPNIARIYDSGLRQGMCYYAMELIDGMPLDRYARSLSLSRKQILALMVKVCQAVLYAHLHAVIHRDLKPSNILVSADGQPHVLDFGLAKALLDEDGAATISVEGQIAGTPAYMSPEQAVGRRDEIDTRADVFSLGVILYELLVGRPPHDRSGSMIALLHEIADGRIQRPRVVNKSIDSELEAVLLKALARDPDERYASAGALAKDITSYLNEEPLDAQVPTTFYFLGKKVRKYRKQVAAVAAVLVLLLATVFIAYTRIVAERAVRQAQETELDLKSQQLTWAELEMRALSGDKEEARAALGILRDEYISAQDEVSRLNFSLAERKPPVAVRRLDLSAGPALASKALVTAPSLPGGIQSWTLEPSGHRGQIARVAFSSDGSHLLSAGYDGTIRVWDVRSGALARILVDPNAATLGLTWSRDGTRLRIDDPINTSQPSVWDIEAGTIGGLSQTLSDQTWDDASAASWFAERRASGRPIDEVADLLGIDLPPGLRASQRSITALAIGSGRNMLAIGDCYGTIRLVDRQSGQLRPTVMGTWYGPVHAVGFSPDNKTLATCAGPGTICLWDAHTWQPLRRFEAGSIAGASASAVGSIAWAPNGAAIAKASTGRREIEILDSQSGALVRALSRVTHDIASICWSPDGTLLAAATDAGPVYLWDVTADSNEPTATLTAESGGINALVWMPEAGNLVTAGDDGHIDLWRAQTGTRIRSIQGLAARTTCLAFSPQSEILASGSDNGIIRLWDPGSGWTSLPLTSQAGDNHMSPFSFTALTWSPDGRQLASGDSAGNIRVWDAQSRRLEGAFSVDCLSVNTLAWSPDGRALLCGGDDGTVRSWDVSDEFREHVVLLPLRGPAGPGIAINAAGDYRGPADIADHLVYAVRTPDAHLTLSPADFKSQYGWVNEPWQVGLYQPGTEDLQRLYVNAASAGPYDGKSWATAFSDLQDALSVAGPNTEIWVAAGTYTPDRGTGARTASFHLKNGVRLLGGFASTETSSYQRDPNTNETILSGDLKGNDGRDFANNDENSYHVVMAMDYSASVTLDGFSITGGNSNRLTEERPGDGGGLHSGAHELTLIDCDFRFNSADEHGGAISHRAGPSSLLLRSCTFRDNRTTNRPHSHGWGGAIVVAGGKGVIADCLFENNVANEGGSILMRGSAQLVLKNCTFVGNRAESSGGAVNVRGGVDATLLAASCRFTGNTAANEGGGIYNSGEYEGALVNCMFVGNRARHGGGGVSNWPSEYGPSTVVLTNCSFVANHSGVAPGGLRDFREARSVLRNCIFWSNTSDDDSLESSQLVGEGILVNNCCIEGWSGSLDGVGNFGRAPLFVDPNGLDGLIGTEDDDLRLRPGSPCINSGSNAALPADTADLDGDGDTDEPIPFDLDGKPRILDGAVDMGAYESE